ncbi:MAG: hypothetical protein QOE65_2038 [Solirubrobacteraceae bacterium]|jgi:hypothetical protein|nr:hypothetical protein [Solirubrobacteraceae bacterium]
MAQTKRKRRSKHRGTPAGTIESRGRTGRKPSEGERAKPAGKRRDRFDEPPNWRGAAQRASIAAGIFFLAVVALFRQPIQAAIPIAMFMLALYIPLGYYTDLFLYRRRQAKKSAPKKPD